MCFNAEDPGSSASEEQLEQQEQTRQKGSRAEKLAGRLQQQNQTCKGSAAHQPTAYKPIAFAVPTLWKAVALSLHDWQKTQSHFLRAQLYLMLSWALKWISATYKTFN